MDCYQTLSFLMFFPFVFGEVWVQQGSKLVGKGGINLAYQGTSIALNQDGNLLIVGGPGDDTDKGAVWTFKSSDNGITWIQQGDKLVCNDCQKSYFGNDVVLSDSNNILAVAGPDDNNNVGAVWIYKWADSPDFWLQQGAKLVGTDVDGSMGARQGAGLSLNAIGTFLAVGGYLNNNGTGAVWFFSQNNDNWIQNGSKLVPTDNVGKSNFGGSVLLSSDASVLAVGGFLDDNSIGAVWIFTRIGSAWIQKDNKLVPNNYFNKPQFGYSLSFPSGNDPALLAIGGNQDDSGHGACWIYYRNDDINKSTWIQWVKLVGPDAVGNSAQGYSVKFSNDGNLLLVGGPIDNSFKGGVWIYGYENGAYNQIQPKVVPNDSINSGLGQSVAISNDGRVIASGGSFDNNVMGATWVFLKNNGTEPDDPSPKKSKVGVTIGVTIGIIIFLILVGLGYRYYKKNYYQDGYDTKDIVNSPTPSTAAASQTGYQQLG